MDALVRALQWGREAGEKRGDGESLKITVGISRSLSCCLRCPLASAYLSVTRSSWHLSIHLDPCQSVCPSNYPLAWQSPLPAAAPAASPPLLPPRHRVAAPPAKTTREGLQGCGTWAHPTGMRESRAGAGKYGGLCCGGVRRVSIV